MLDFPSLENPDEIRVGFSFIGKSRRDSCWIFQHQLTEVVPSLYQHHTNWIAKCKQNKLVWRILRQTTKTQYGASSLEPVHTILIIQTQPTSASKQQLVLSFNRFRFSGKPQEQQQQQRRQQQQQRRQWQHHHGLF